MPVLIEVNSGREPQKFGIFPEKVEDLARAIIAFSNLRLAGLMTMGPAEGQPEEARPYFRETRQLYDYLRNLNLPRVDLHILSMGMTNSYRIAIEEGHQGPSWNKNLGPAHKLILNLLTLKS